MSSLLCGAGLGGAVANAIGPVGLGAETAHVAGGAAELGVGDASHVVGAQLGARAEILGHGDAGDSSKDGKGLHVGGDEVSRGRGKDKR